MRTFQLRDHGVGLIATSFRTSGSLACNGISSLSFRELDVVLRKFGPVNHSDSARFCAFIGRVARSAGFSFVST